MSRPKSPEPRSYCPSCKLSFWAKDEAGQVRKRCPHCDRPGIRPGELHHGRDFMPDESREGE